MWTAQARQPETWLSWATFLSNAVLTITHKDLYTDKDLWRFVRASFSVVRFAALPRHALLGVDPGCWALALKRNQVWCGERCGIPPSSKSGEGFIRAPLRCALACGARKDPFFSLPSAYPFSAQARLGPRWANLSSRLRRFILVAMTVSLTLCESMAVPC